VDKFTKWGYFIGCTKEIKVENLAELYIKYIFTQHGALKKIILNKNSKFIIVF
jgi:hypothetical protein